MLPVIEWLLCVRLHSICSGHVNPLNAQQPYDISNLIVPISQMRKLRRAEVKTQTRGDGVVRQG